MLLNNNLAQNYSNNARFTMIIHKYTSAHHIIIY